jgi:GDP-4-dehydro-6-deoxy-D-mannose reductase
MDRVLITGADGFVASHLIRELDRETDWKLTGLGLKPGLEVDGVGIEYRVVDLTDRDLLLETLEEIRPDGIFHLAAQPSVAFSWEDPWATYGVNLIGQLNLLEGLRKTGAQASVHIACSSEEYGKVPAEQMPLGEETPLNPCSHYAVSKVAQETLGRMYHQAFGWRVLITRGFNQAGPGQSPDFVVSSFARQIALIEAGRSEPVLKVGNLEARRDFTDVRDTVRAYRLVMEKGAPGAVYNVASGTARPVSELLEMLLSFSEAAIGVERDPDRQRPSDIPVVMGDCSRLWSDTGWEPLIPLERTLLDTLDYWRARVGRAA